jgi:hypothetical protein
MREDAENTDIIQGMIVDASFLLRKFMAEAILPPNGSTDSVRIGTFIALPSLMDNYNENTYYTLTTVTWTISLGSTYTSFTPIMHVCYVTGDPRALFPNATTANSYAYNLLGMPTLTDYATLSPGKSFTIAHTAYQWYGDESIVYSNKVTYTVTFSADGNAFTIVGTVPSGSFITPTDLRLHIAYWVS